MFFKKYSLANSGDNGVWLCKNHHNLFDRNYFCFESSSGKILFRFNSSADAIEFANKFKDAMLSDKILTSETKAFLKQRELNLII